MNRFQGVAAPGAALVLIEPNRNSLALRALRCFAKFGVCG
jgi:hypothetical protein